MSEAEKQIYLASDEWAAKRAAVRKRARGRCERCRWRRMQACHHLTYERLGHERLEDLQAICDACHKFVHGLAMTMFCRSTVLPVLLCAVPRWLRVLIALFFGR